MTMKLQPRFGALHPGQRSAATLHDASHRRRVGWANSAAPAQPGAAGHGAAGTVSRLAASGRSPEARRLQAAHLTEGGDPAAPRSSRGASRPQAAAQTSPLALAHQRRPAARRAHQALARSAIPSFARESPAFTARALSRTTR
jgi:hypothetical protein